MKLKSKIVMILGLMVTLAFFAGCSSLQELKIAQAAVKSANVKSAESETVLSVNVTQLGSANENLEVGEEDNNYFEKERQDKLEKLLDIVNNASVKITAKNDFANNKAYVKAVGESNGISVAAQAYSANNKAWVKMPTKSKYIEIDPSKLGSKNSANAGIEFRDLTYKFLQDYIGNSDFSFENIKDKGMETITTPEGQKEVNNYEISLNKDQVAEFGEYIFQNFGESDKAEEYLKALYLLTVKSLDTSKLEDFDAKEVQSELETALKEARVYSENNAGDMIDELLAGVEFGPNGVKFTIGIDKNGDIANLGLTVDTILVQDLGDGTAKYNVNFNLNTKIYNIDKTSVEVPSFTGVNTIAFKDYVKNSEFWKDSPIGEILGVASVYLYIPVGEEYTYKNREGVEVKFTPYVDNDEIYVPGSFLGEKLGAEVQWNKLTKTMTFVTDTKTIKIKAGSKYARINGKTERMPFSAQMKDGIFMVPAGLIAEKIGANEVSMYSGISFEYNEEPGGINITKY